VIGSQNKGSAINLYSVDAAVSRHPRPRACFRKYSTSANLNLPTREIPSDIDQAGRTTNRIRFCFPLLNVTFRNSDKQALNMVGWEAQMKVHPIFEKGRAKSPVIKINQVQP